MKKYIEISEEVLRRLENGEPVEGRLWMLTFKAYNRKPRNQSSDELVHQLETGWVKESPEKYKLFISVYKKLGLARILSIIDRETKEAKSALFDKEMIESI